MSVETRIPFEIVTNENPDLPAGSVRVNLGIGGLKEVEVTGQATLGEVLSEALQNTDQSLQLVRSTDDPNRVVSINGGIVYVVRGTESTQTNDPNHPIQPGDTLVASRRYTNG